MIGKHGDWKEKSDITSEPLPFILFLEKFNSVKESLLGDKCCSEQMGLKIGSYF